MAERLDGVELLACVPPVELMKLERSCVWRYFARNEQIVDRDSTSRDVFFVVGGSVRIVNHSLAGREISYASVHAGGFFGELSALDGAPRSATAIAIQPCDIASMPPSVFIDLMRTYPEIGLEVSRRLARIIRICDDRIMDLATLGSVQRVCLEILRLAGPDAEEIARLPTQAEIAARAVTSRETVARAIGQMTSDGLIERKGRKLTILDRRGLADMAERWDADLVR